jgi:hypothetical protein
VFCNLVSVNPHDDRRPDKQADDEYQQDLQVKALQRLRNRLKEPSTFNAGWLWDRCFSRVRHGESEASLRPEKKPF